MTWRFLDYQPDNAALIDLYHSVVSKMVPLDLKRSFDRNGYAHNNTTNPMWIELHAAECPVIAQVLDDLCIEPARVTVTMSDLLPGFCLSEHRDMGRRSVIIIPVLGYDAPIIIQGQEVHYHGRCLLLDATQLHSVPPQQHNRVGLQISFRENYDQVSSVLI
jgi:hypothetical protein